MQRYYYLSAVLLLSFVLSINPGLGQVTGGLIEGQIKDSTGGVLPGVQVTAINQETGLRRSGVSGQDGFFRIISLPPGAYTLQSALPGFESQELKDIRLEGTANVSVNVVLKVASVAETVTVTAAPANIDTTSQTLRTVLDETALGELPINGRRTQDFALLSPSVDVGGPIIKDKTHFFFSWEHWDSESSDFVTIPATLLDFLPDPRTEVPVTFDRDNFVLKFDHILN